MMAGSQYQLLSDIYKKVFTTLYAHTQIYIEDNSCKLSYIKTFQSRFYPVRGNDFEHKGLYPFLSSICFLILFKLCSFIFCVRLFIYYLKFII